jgi:hypothetical protein
VSLTDSTSAGSGSLAVEAAGLRVEGDARFAVLRADGAVTMQGAQVMGSVDLTGARVTYPGARRWGWAML